MLLLVAAAAAGPAQGQEGAGVPGPVSPDSADVLRRRMERPRADHETTIGDVVELPLEVAALPLRLGVDGLTWVAGRLAEPERYAEITRAYRRVESVGLRPRLGTELGPRSGLGVSLGYVGLQPLVMESGISIRGSQRHRAGLEWSSGAWTVGAGIRFRRHAQEHFWGVGPDSPYRRRSDFRWDQAGAEASASLRPWPALELRAGASIQDNRVGPGLDDARPDSREVFEPDALFGLGEDTRYLRFDAGVAVDRTHWHELQLRGFRAEVEASRFRGVDGTPSDVTRLRGRAQLYLPVTSRHLFAMRSWVETNRGSDRGVPFTHLAALGGSRTLRAYEWGRFRDRDLVAVTGEWRYEIWRDLRERGRVEACVFWEEGGVARRLGHLAETRSSYGLGLIMAWDRRVAATTWVAFGEENPRFSASLSGPFEALIGRGGG